MEINHRQTVGCILLITLLVLAGSCDSNGPGRQARNSGAAKMASQPAIIPGEVRDSDGKAVLGARVYFSGGPGNYPDIAALTGPDGRFTLSAPIQGTYTIECDADGFQKKRVTATVTGAGTKEIRIELAPAK